MLLHKSDLLVRLRSKTIIIGDHWLFNGSLDSDGYGNMWDGEKINRTHRLSAYIHLDLDVKDSSQQALHKNTCSYRNCWNPNCLYIGTREDNMRDMKNTYSSNTLFRCGHPKTQVNSCVMGGRKRCKTCYTRVDKLRRGRERMRKNTKTTNQNQTTTPTS